MCDESLKNRTEHKPLAAGIERSVDFTPPPRVDAVFASASEAKHSRRLILVAGNNIK